MSIEYGEANEHKSVYDGPWPQGLKLCSEGTKRLFSEPDTLSSSQPSRKEAACQESKKQSQPRKP